MNMLARRGWGICCARHHLLLWCSDFSVCVLQCGAVFSVNTVDSRKQNVLVCATLDMVGFSVQVRAVGFGTGVSVFALDSCSRRYKNSIK